MTYPICERLREEAMDCSRQSLDLGSAGAGISAIVADKAAATIEELAAALEPLSAMDAPTKIGFAFDAWADDRVVFDIGKDRKITAGDLRRAREALRKLKGE